MTKVEMNRGFTLVELILVIVLIGILAALGLPNYNKAKERAISKEAITNLKIIQAAEKYYKLETGTYYPNDGFVKTDINWINGNLSLSLGEISWDYYITGNGAIDFTASAKRQSGDYASCIYSIDQSASEPTGTNCL